jgi:hypothetical protein
VEQNSIHLKVIVRFDDNQMPETLYSMALNTKEDFTHPSKKVSQFYSSKF